VINPLLLAEWAWGVLVALVMSMLPGGSPASSSIDVIEARGAAYASLPSPGELPHDFVLPYLRGGAERACVEASNSPARSGEWVFFPYGYASYWRPDRESMKTGWGDLHPSEDPGDAPLTLHATNLAPPFETYRLEIPSYTAYGNIDDRREYFYALGDFILPSLGTWAVEVTSRENWGCFVIVLDEIAPVERPTYVP